MRKLALVFVVGIVGYIAILGLVKVFYQADPADMKWQERETYNAMQIGQLELGKSKDQVIRMLGSPDINEAKKTDQGDLHVLFYRTHHVTSDGITTKDECTALLFANNKLTAWGSGAYDSYKGTQ